MKYYKKNWLNIGLLIAVIILYLSRVLSYFNDSYLTPDAITHYLPYAKEILNQGFGFFSTEKSLIVTPISYLWVALFGANVLLVKYVNVIAGVFMLLLLYSIGKRVHSFTVGIIAAFLFARSPLLIHWIPTVLSEPPFYLFTLLWLWSISGIILHKKGAILVASVALSLSILARPVWLYPSIILIFITVAWYFLSGSNKETAVNLIKSFIFGLILPLIIIVKNYFLFDIPAIAFGSGFALYAGTNLMTNGFEPYYLGTGYGGSLNHMSVIGDREHSLVAFEFLKDRTWIDLIGWISQKIQWVLLFSPVDVSYKVSVWRGIEISFAFVGLWWGVNKKSVFISILGLAFVLQLFQTSLVLYNSRYSADNLEFLLILLAAVGIVVSCKSIYGVLQPFIFSVVGREQGVKTSTNYPSAKYGVVSFIILLLLMKIIDVRSIPKLHLPSHIPVTTLFEHKKTINIDTALVVENRGKKVVINTTFDVPKQDLPDEPDYSIWQIQVAILPESNGYCDGAFIKFKPFNQKQDGKAIYFKPLNDGAMRTYTIGAAGYNQNIFPLTQGKLTLSFICMPGAKIIIKNTALLVPHMVKQYWDNINNI